jgi:hypothetical protein
MGRLSQLRPSKPVHAGDWRSAQNAKPVIHPIPPALIEFPDGEAVNWY